jgi:flavocytochrome c
MEIVMWDQSVDVLVIGSGFAGLSAAIEASKAGATTIIIDKMHVPGGNSAISGGLLSAAGSPLQEQSGIYDSVSLMVADMLAAGQHLNHPNLARIVAEHSVEALLWTIEELGVQYKDRLSHLGGHSVPRTYNTRTTSGAGIIRPMLACCRKMGIPIRLATYLERFITDPQGAVEGVVVREGYVFPNAESGTEKRIRARRAIILASGGFARDVAFRTIQNPMLSQDIQSTNHPGATAETLKAVLTIGGTPVHLSHIQLGPWSSRDEEGFGVGSMFSMLAGFPYGILVDVFTGKRFVNELADRRLLVDAMLMSGVESIAIVDQSGVREASTLDQCLKRGVVAKYDSIEALAEANHIPADSLQLTIRKYNSFVEKGVDEEYGKPISRDSAPITTPPFYSIRLISKVHYCMGGLLINEDAQVMHIQSRLPVGRLYAAGEITGGIHGASRLGGNSIVECIVFGRIAGQKAALETIRA